MQHKGVVEKLIKQKAKLNAILVSGPSLSAIFPVVHKYKRLFNSFMYESGSNKLVSITFSHDGADHC